MTSSSDDDASNIDALDFLEYLMILYQMHRQQHQNFQIEVVKVMGLGNKSRVLIG